MMYKINTNNYYRSYNYFVTESSMTNKQLYFLFIYSLSSNKSITTSNMLVNNYNKNSNYKREIKI